MITMSILMTMCTVTVPTADPMKDPVFTDCQEQVVLIDLPTQDPNEAAMLCFYYMNEIGVEKNTPAMAAIRKALKFPYTHPDKVIKSSSCRQPVSPQVS